MSLIQAAKNLMNAVVQTVKASYVASTKYQKSQGSPMPPLPPYIPPQWHLTSLASPSLLLHSLCCGDASLSSILRGFPFSQP